MKDNFENERTKIFSLNDWTKWVVNERKTNELKEKLKRQTDY